jgi:hypothetical protein
VVEEGTRSVVVLAVQEVPDLFPLAAPGQLGREVDRRADFLDPRLALGVVERDLDQELAALAAVAVALHLDGGVVVLYFLVVLMVVVFGAEHRGQCTIPAVRIVPLSFSEARVRPAAPPAPPGPAGHQFSVAVQTGRGIAGVAVVGRPVSRALDDGRTLEVTRLCSDAERLLHALRGGPAGDEGNGVLPDRHLHAGQRGRRVAEGERLEAGGDGAEAVLELPLLPPQGPAPPRRQGAVGV